MVERTQPEILVQRERCPYCHDPVLPSDTKLSCDGCMAWHHRGCWNEHGKCSACGTARFAGAPSDSQPLLAAGAVRARVLLGESSATHPLPAQRRPHDRPLAAPPEGAIPKLNSTESSDTHPVVWAPTPGAGARTPTGAALNSGGAVNPPMLRPPGERAFVRGSRKKPASDTQPLRPPKARRKPSVPQLRRLANAFLVCSIALILAVLTVLATALATGNGAGGLVAASIGLLALILAPCVIAWHATRREIREREAGKRRP